MTIFGGGRESICSQMDKILNGSTTTTFTEAFLKSCFSNQLTYYYVAQLSKYYVVLQSILFYNIHFPIFEIIHCTLVQPK